jgi:hypothetical protein
MEYTPMAEHGSSVCVVCTASCGHHLFGKGSRLDTSLNDKRLLYSSNWIVFGDGGCE